MNKEHIHKFISVKFFILDNFQRIHKTQCIDLQLYIFYFGKLSQQYSYTNISFSHNNLQSEATTDNQHPQHIKSRSQDAKKPVCLF